MSKRRVKNVLLCEDRQHEAFFRYYLEQIGYNPRKLDVQKASTGSGEQWVRNRYPIELRAYRKHSEDTHNLIVVIDGDGRSLEDRRAQLQSASSAESLPERGEDEAVSILVPRRNIETWIRYLQGEPVQEDHREAYPKLGRESDCYGAVDRLLAIRANNWMAPDDCPPSLRAGLVELRRLRT